MPAKLNKQHTDGRRNIATISPNRVNRVHWPTKENWQNSIFFCICSAHGKIASNGPKWGRELFFPTNPDLANILGRTDFDFENFYFWDLFGFQIPRFPGPQISRSPEIWPGPGLGRAWALGRVGPSGGRVGPRVGPSGGPTRCLTN